MHVHWLAPAWELLPVGHKTAAVELARQKELTGHAEIDAGLLQKLPAGHALAWMDPVGQNWPAAQGMWVEGVAHT